MNYDQSTNTLLKAGYTQLSKGERIPPFSVYVRNNGTIETKHTGNVSDSSGWFAPTTELKRKIKLLTKLNALRNRQRFLLNDIKNIDLSIAETTNSLLVYENLYNLPEVIESQIMSNTTIVDEE